MNSAIHFGMITFLLVVCLLLSPGMVNAQKRSCTLNGSISLEGGDVYPFSIIINDDETGIVNGVSIIDQEGTIVSTRVNGTYDKHAKTLAVTETEVIGELSDSIELCFVDVVLRWEQKRGMLLFTGSYAGKDKMKNFCGKGTVNLKAQARACPMFLNDSIPPNPPPPPMTLNGTPDDGQLTPQ